MIFGSRSREELFHSQLGKAPSQLLSQATPADPLPRFCNSSALHKELWRWSRNVLWTNKFDTSFFHSTCNAYVCQSCQTENFISIFLPVYSQHLTAGSQYIFAEWWMNNYTSHTTSTIILTLDNIWLINLNPKLWSYWKLSGNCNAMSLHYFSVSSSLAILCNCLKCKVASIMCIRLGRTLNKISVSLKKKTTAKETAEC